MVDRIDENNLVDNGSKSQSQYINSPGFNPSIEITGFASKSGDNDYYRYSIGSSSRSKFSISLTYSHTSQFQQPFNPQKPVLVRDIFNYTASILSENQSLDFILKSQPTGSIFVDNDSLVGKDPIVFYTNKQIYNFYIVVQGVAGYEGDTKLPQQYYKLNINKLNGPLGELLTNGEIGFSKTITADFSKVSDLDGIKIGSEKIEWFRGQKLLSTGKNLILSNDLAFEPIYYKLSYIDGRGDSEYVLSNSFKPEVTIDPLKITINQSNQSIILGNNFNYTPSKIFIFQGEVLISEVDNISDFKISKSYVGSEFSLIVAASDGKFYKSTTLKISNINHPALRNGTPLLDVVEAGKDGAYSIILSNQKIVDDDGMSYTANGSFTLNIDGQSSQQLIAREQTWAKDYGIRPLRWLESSFNFQDEHVGKNYEVIFSFLDNLGNSEKVVVNKGKVLNLNDKPTGLLSITDIATQGQTLKLTNTLADEDGLGTFSYQWQSNGISISGATGSSYTLNQAEVGNLITVVAGYTDGFGTIETVTSNVTLAVKNVNDAPTGSVTITGTATQGQVLTATNTLADIDGIPTSGSGAISYQWLAAGVNITGGTSSTLVLSSAEVGKPITVVASYIDGFNQAESVTSSATANVANIGLPNIGISKLTGHGYDWKTHTLLSNVDVKLTSQKSVTNISSKSGVDGTFAFESLDVGGYKLEVSKALTTAETGSAINSADALAALKIAVGRNPNADPDGAGPLLAPPVSPYQFMAADANQDGKVTSADALAILKMAVKRSDAPAREWLFVNENQDFWNEVTSSFTTTRSKVEWDKELQVSSPLTTQQNVVAVLKGDVNGSWTPPAGAQDLDITSPAYFADLASKMGVPANQWAVIG